MNNEELGRLVLELLNVTGAAVVLNYGENESELICGLVDSDVRIIQITKITGVHSSRAGKGIRTPDIMLGNNPVSDYLKKLNRLVAEFGAFFISNESAKLEDLVYEICAMLMSHHMVDRRDRQHSSRSIADLSYDEIKTYGLEDALEDYRIEESHELEFQIREDIEEGYVEEDWDE